MTTYHFTNFRSRLLTAKSVSEHGCELEDRPNIIGLHTWVSARTAWERLQGKAHFWSGGRYVEQHNKTDWLGTSQLSLEWDGASGPALLERLEELGWHYLLSDTVNDDGLGILVQFPFEYEVTDPVLYTRIAAIMSWLIGVPGLRDGSDAITYLWQWNLQGTEPFERENLGHLIDPNALRAKHPHKWIVFNDMVGKGRKREAPKPLPTTGDELFQWGAL
jgi:hypothetical protein